jgi:effector-binding domain-containing protein
VTDEGSLIPVDDFQWRSQVGPVWLLTREAERNSTLAERGASSSARSPYLCTGRAAPVKDETRAFGHDSGPLILSEGMEELMFAEQHEGTVKAVVFIPTDAPARSVGRVEPLTVPQAELAVMVHRGSLADFDLTYGKLGEHVLGYEISVDGPLREYYLVGFLDEPDPASWETEIGWPIFRSDS